ncbi:MAG: histidine--tRNA ligase [Oligoflexia bacterium]|nr:histidine--tRNA ligase [Oligoflexia bacterium]
MNIKSIKGMNDVLEPEIFAWRHAETLIRMHFEAYGYTEIKTPIVEPTALFARTVGDTTDIVTKEMYTFKDRNDDSLTLRPEETACVVRSLVEHNILNNEPVQKLYYWGPMFRYERPQKGRYRQFHQYGIEVLGIASPKIDAELIGMLVSLYEKFELKGLNVKLASLGCEACRPVYREQLVKILTPSINVLCPDCQIRLEKNPLRVFDCKNPTCKEVAAVLPCMLDFLCQPCHEHFDSVRDHLVRLKTPFVVDKRLVRGIDYYNRTVFEISSSQLGAQDAVGGGGRYDKLVSLLGGPDTPAVGFAGGVERLILLIADRIEQFRPKLKLFIVLPDDRGQDLAFVLAQKLRNSGVRVELDYTGKSMKSQMKRADKLKAQYSLIMGGSEIDQGFAVFRNMATKTQENIKLDDLEIELLRRLS